jgi:hypothetical protein
MKHNIKIFGILLALTAIISACKKNSFFTSERSSNEGMAQVKLGYFSAYTVAPTTILYINDKPVSHPLTAAISFPGGGLNMGGSLNGDYLLVKPGSNKIEGFVPVPLTNNIAYKLFEFNQSFDANKSYTFFITDTAANTTGFSIVDEKTVPDSGYARIKFVNAMPNEPALDLYKGANVATAVAIATNVNFKSASDYIDIPIMSDSFYIRAAGSSPTSNPLARRLFSASNFTNQRIYTILGRGYSGVTTPTTLRPELSAIVNQ